MIFFAFTYGSRLLLLALEGRIWYQRFMDIYLVGGAVRDLLLGRAPTDRDYLVLGASREELLARMPRLKEVGATTASFVLHKGVEFALPRAAPPGEAGGDPLMADLLARDLTINAMAMADDGTLTAHPMAMEDLRNRFLRPAWPFALMADPARIFRAARFAAELPDFRPHPELLEAMRQAAPHAASLPRERVAKELLKALAAPRPFQFIELLHQAGALAPWFSELQNATDIPAGPAPYHTGSVLRHMGRVMDRLAAASPTPDPLLVWMGLCHDLGKTVTPAEDWPRHHDHDTLGAVPAKSLGERLGLSANMIHAGLAAARLHMRAAKYRTLRPGTSVDLLDELHHRGLVERMFALVGADEPEAGVTVDACGQLARAQADLAAMLAVRLPPELRDQGPESGKRLRELRCMAVAAVRNSTASPAS